MSQAFRSLTTLKMAAVAPIPRTSVKRAIPVKPGDLAIVLNEHVKVLL